MFRDSWLRSIAHKSGRKLSSWKHSSSRF